jgi:plastocyanin
MARRALVIGAATMAVAAAGCGGGSGGGGGAYGGGGSSGGAAPATGTVKIASFKFAPPKIVVRRGATVTWTNVDNADHTATADAGGFDAGTVRRGKSVTVHMSKAGTFAYHCDFHPFMKGTVVVK